MEDRSWAANLTQEEFNIQWSKRFPKYDVTPDVKTWANPLPTENNPSPGVTDLIEPFNKELMENGINDTPKIPDEKNEELKKEKQGHLKATYQCQFCNMTIKAKIGLISHEKACPKGLNKPLKIRPVGDTIGKANLSIDNESDIKEDR